MTQHCVYRYSGVNATGAFIDTVRVFGSMILVTRVSSNNVNIAGEHQEPVEVLSQLGNTFTPQIPGSKSVAGVAASGVVCDRSICFHFKSL